MTKILNLENDTIHFWLDHLEVYGTFKYESELFNSLDFDNSNYGEIEEFSFTKNEVPRYLYKIIFTKNNYSLFAYYKWDNSQNIVTKDYIVIYSTAFKILSYDEILYFLEWYFNLKHCRRFDICIDIIWNINEVLKYFDEFQTGREYRKSWEIETRYIWEVKNSLNKRTLLRIYDKQKDLIQKKKIWLYEDYFDYENITRVELEVRQELAKNRNYEEIFDNSLLVWIFKNYIYKHTKIFESLSGEQTSLYKKKETFDPEKFQALYYRTQRKNIFLWHAKTIYNMWFCPVRVLLAEWYIKELTKQALWVEKIEALIKREKNIIERAKENKEIIINPDKILSKFYRYGK